MKISGINFSEKTVENIEVCGIIKEIKCESHDNIFKITVMNNNDEVIEEVLEVQKVDEGVEDEVIEQEVVAEPQIKK